MFSPMVPSAALTELDRAILLATMAHAHQIDKGGRPYIYHPLRVMLSLLPHVPFYSTELLPVAVLHDVIEDTSCQLQELTNVYDSSSHIIECLDYLTLYSGQSREGYIHNIFRPIWQTRIPRIVKLADMLDNTSSGRLDFLPRSKAKKLIEKYCKDFKIIQQYFKTAKVNGPEAEFVS
jgi:(p)ppGpp synthase/HD superfamily hydrolase